MTIIFTTRPSEKNIKENLITKKDSLKAPEPIGPYSKYRKIGDLYFFSGQIGIDANTGNIVSWGIEEEAMQVCRNIKAMLREINLGLKDVIKTTIFLKNIEDFGKVNDIYKDYFVLKPARSTVWVNKLPKDALVEIEVIAGKQSFS